MSMNLNAKSQMNFVSASPQPQDGLMSNRTPMTRRMRGSLRAELLHAVSEGRSQEMTSLLQLRRSGIDAAEEPQSAFPARNGGQNHRGNNNPKKLQNETPVQPTPNKPPQFVQTGKNINEPTKQIKKKKTVLKPTPCTPAQRKTYIAKIRAEEGDIEKMIKEGKLKEASKLVQELPEGAIKEELMKKIIDALCREGRFREAFDVANTLPDKVRNAAKQKIAHKQWMRIEAAMQAGLKKNGNFETFDALISKLYPEEKDKWEKKRKFEKLKNENKMAWNEVTKTNKEADSLPVGKKLVLLEQQIKVM